MIVCRLNVEKIFGIFNHSTILTLLPSISKCVKLTVILHWGGARISQMQFLFAGYRSGNDGDVIVPFEVSISPPHASKIY